MKNERQKGAIVVEATISLTAFMFAVVTVLTIVNVCLVQARVGIAINLAAKDISQYTYIYNLAGLGEKQDGLSQKADAARVSIDEAIDACKDGVKGVESILKVADDIGTDGDLQKSIFALMGNAAIETGKSFVTAQLVKCLVKERLSTGEEDCDAYLKRMGIRDGLKGINFNKSVVCLNGSEEIKIIADYDVHLIPLLNLDIPFHFTQCAATKAWMVSAIKAESGSGKKEKETEGSTETQAESETERDSDSETESETKKKTCKDYAEEATHNASSDQVVLGMKSVDPMEDYRTVAKMLEATYMELDGQQLAEAKREYGKMAEYEIQKEFLKQQLKEGKTIYLKDNPFDPEMDDIYWESVNFLEQQGYTFTQVVGTPGTELWRAEKK